MGRSQGQTAQLSHDFGQLRDRVRNLVEEALATLPQIDGLPPARLAELRDALFHTEHPYLLAFVGPFSSGKSSLINALLLHDRAYEEAAAPEPPLAVGPVPTTDRIAILRWGAENERRREGESVDGVYFPAAILQRVSFVDTPGLGSVFQAQESITQRFLHRSDTVCWVMSARQALSAENLEDLRELKEFGKKTILLLNQADTLDESERHHVLEFVREQSQARLGWQPRVWLVSAKAGLAAQGENAAQRWQESGLDGLLASIEEQLGDQARLQQKLSTPLQIVQRANREAQTIFEANQAHWDELGRAVANLEGQVVAAHNSANVALEAARQNLATTGRVVQEAVVEGWQAAFAWRKIPRLVGWGLLELLGLGWLARRGKSGRNLLPAGLLQACEEWQDVAEKLAGRLEARDWQDLGDLLEAAKRALAQLPEEARSQMVGNLAAPSRYDRSALEETRYALRRLADETRRAEEKLFAVKAQRLWNGVSALQLTCILLALGTFAGRALLAEWRPEAPLYALLLLAGGFIAGACWLPIAARWQAARFARRWRKPQGRALELLNEGAKRQLDYGQQLRQDAWLPLQRLWEVHSSRQQQQRSALHLIQQQVNELEGAIHNLGRLSLGERLRTRLSSPSRDREDAAEPVTAEEECTESESAAASESSGER